MKNEDILKTGIRLTLPEGRLSYLNVFKPAPSKHSEKTSYRTNVLWPASEEKKSLKPLIDAVNKIGIEAFGSDYPQRAANGELHTPIKYGNESMPDDLNYKDMIYVNPSTSGGGAAPKVVDRQLQPIISPDDAYSGCYGIVSVTVKPFFKGKTGTTIFLGNVQVTKKGEPLAGGNVSPERDFTPLDDEENGVDDLV